MNLTYALLDLRRNLRIFSSIFFIIVLPCAFFIIFGALQSFSTQSIGRGNVSALVMISMGTYGAVIATSALSGAAAVEQQQGWGRQLALTSLTRGGFVANKVFVALVIAALPLIAVYAIGALTVAKADAIIWITTPFIALACSTVFALYGLAIGFAFRSEAAAGVAGGTIVILAFLGNAFIPLSGTMLEVGRFTPLYGVMALARYPLTEGYLGTADGSGPGPQDSVWALVANVVVWTVIFAGAAILFARRGTARQ